MIDPAVAEAACPGLCAPKKWLPSWLLYDEAGCQLYEQITRLPEYYLTRAEAEIFERQGDAMVALAAAPGRRVAFAELGAGTATKTEAMLEAALRAQGSCVYLACDIAASALQRARQRLRRKLPGVEMRTFVGSHGDAGPSIAALAERQVVLFIGSSIGNYTDDEAIQLLARLRRSLRADAVLMLGADVAKSPEVMRRAYDDEQGVTAAFSKNLLVRLNRDLEATFDLEAFRHVAVWNEVASNIEVYLEALREQRVWVGALGRELVFAEGERIHTETCAKYELPRVERILASAGFARAQTYMDSAGLFAVHLARLAARS
jgi:L-histidine N-alpha-methyltransferase